MGGASTFLHSVANEPHFWRRDCLARSLHVPVSRFDYNWKKCYIEHMHHLPPQNQHRLLILKAAANEAAEIRNSDGVLLSVLNTGIGDTFRRTQPTWSRDGRFVATSRIAIVNGEEKYFAEVADLQSGQVRSWNVATPPFYFSWSPDSTILIYLTSKNALLARYIDIFETPDVSVAGTHEDVSTELFTSSAFFFSHCPIPGVDRLLASVPGGICGIVGLSGSTDIIPIRTASKQLKEHLEQENMPNMTLPAAFRPKYEAIDDSEAPQLYPRFTFPLWTCNNTMVLCFQGEAEPRQFEVVAFDSIWDPAYDASSKSNDSSSSQNEMHNHQKQDEDPKKKSTARQKSISEVYYQEGLEAASRLMKDNRMQEDLAEGAFTLPLPSKRFVLDRINSLSVQIIGSPDGRFVAIYTPASLTIVELLFEEAHPSNRSDSYGAEGRTFFSSFAPRRLSGSCVIFRTKIPVLAAIFAPNSKSILFLTLQNAASRWNSLNISKILEVVQRPSGGASQAQTDSEPSNSLDHLSDHIVKYTEFPHAPFFFNHYLPFMPQYTQSIQLHSPDSTMFAYSAGMTIWIQDIVGDPANPPAPRVAGTGIFSTWSPV